MISNSVRCCPRLVWVAVPYRFPVPNQYSSSRWLATQSESSRKQTLMQKYESYLEKNCPKCYKVHRMVIDGCVPFLLFIYIWVVFFIGCKSCVTDVKTYYVIRRDLNTGKISMSDLNRQQLECYIQVGLFLRKIQLTEWFHAVSQWNCPSIGTHCSAQHSNHWRYPNFSSVSSYCRFGPCMTRSVSNSGFPPLFTVWNRDFESSDPNRTCSIDCNRYPGTAPLHNLCFCTRYVSNLFY